MRSAEIDTGVGPNDRAVEADEFRRDVVQGLEEQQKRIPSKYLYDLRGSKLFDRITELDEYYPTRTELLLLRERSRQIANAVGPRAVVIEPGAGSSLKIRTLLDSLHEPRAFMPIDIAGEHLAEAIEQLAPDYPDVQMIPVAADFTQSLELPTIKAEDEPLTGARLVFFPGSTIGNFEQSQQRRMLESMRELSGSGGFVLVGIDLRKNLEVLIRAYDDAEGVTAEFNLNLLRRVRDELGATIDLAAFEHEVRYDEKQHRIEMHLRSRERQQIELGGQTFDLEEGETILTEHSHKFTIDGFAGLASEAGLNLAHAWSDPQQLFALILFENGSEEPASTNHRPR